MFILFLYFLYFFFSFPYFYRGQAYNNIANMLKKYGVVFDFTCFEMKDSEQPGYACSSPEQLVGQTLNSSRGKGIINIERVRLNN